MNTVLRITEMKNMHEYLNKINIFLNDLVLEYPLHEQWFEGVAKQLVCNSGEREILFVQNSEDDIIGVAILKKGLCEKKICTLRVAKEFQRRGIGTMLVKESCDFLNTNKPIITVSQTKHSEFIHLFKKFNFEIEKIYCGKYRDMCIEYCYNGILLPETILKEAQSYIESKDEIA
ncbi:MAG: GNAT family N-acetyltransferase [Lachnospiraceae bacterium]|nr:GNAT family N-acetyltransferase [Lachnospiraceae bacterium]